MSCVRHLLATGEKNADYLTFEISKNYHNVDLSECNFILRAVNSAGNLIEQTLKKQTDSNSIFLTWKVDEYFTAVSGVLKLEIRGVKGDELVIKYDLSDIILRESAVGEGLPEIPDTSVIQGENGLTGARGTDGIDGFSPTIEVLENTETSYKLMITNKTNTFETPNLKGLNGVSGGEISITVDSELSGTSENPVQNKVISGEISTLQNQISNLNDLISTIQTNSGSLKVTTLFDSFDYEKYKDLWSFRCSHWDDRIFSFDETATKNTAEFDVIPAFYATNTYISANFKPISDFEIGNYYLRFKVNTTNPTFTIRKIFVVSG